MKAAVFHTIDHVQLEEQPIPQPTQNEILVEMRACGICGTDLMAWYLKERAPIVLGHEPSGIIVKLGDNVEQYSIGDRVFVHHHVACLACHYCLRGDYTLCRRFSETNIEPGGFSEYFKVPAPNLQTDTLKLPDSLTYEEATLIEPVACCLRALKKCSLQSGDTVAILGAGPSGIINTLLSREFGATQIIVSDLVPYRLEAAKRFGASETVNSQRESLLAKVREATGTIGADIVVVTAPTVQALKEGLTICRKGGTLCLFAPTPPNKYMRLSPHQLFVSEIKIVPSYSASHVETREALTFLTSGRINVKALITHRFPLARIKEAFAITRTKRCLKVVVKNNRM